ncbi:MAG TPA: glycosyltransferase [Myxococcota bacterium]|jgi:glycosyltransferase involved in cell wall biosynthesis|nr:glycosyltransferase [Myxococcota bacterium]
MQFHVLSFEGPDGYARAGGIASRIEGLTESLEALGYETHLWFVGDPDAPGYEVRGNLHLHRWCQWISRFHPGGVYDGEEGKERDFASSLPPRLVHDFLSSHLRAGGHGVVLAEEWHTAHSVLHLDWLLREAGLRDRASLLWNANNVFGFERIDWRRLDDASVITTVSRYMRHSMRNLGVDPIVVPNGLPAHAYLPPDREGVRELRRRLAERVVLSKMARFDPDKRWLTAIEIVKAMKQQGLRPLLVARGGSEAHGHEVFRAAHAAGLRIADRCGSATGIPGLLDRLSGAEDADILNLRLPVDPESRRVLFAGADAVLANSGHEPFGLVGLETMAAGGVAVTGISGEDYAVPGRNALVMQTNDPREFVGLFRRLRQHPAEERALRRAGRETAIHYAWPEVIRRNFLPRLELFFGSTA